MSGSYFINGGTLFLDAADAGSGAAKVPPGGDLVWFGGASYEYNTNFTVGLNFPVSTVALRPGESFVDIYVGTLPNRPLGAPTPPTVYQLGTTLNLEALGYGPLTVTGAAASGEFIVAPIAGENANLVSFVQCLAAGTLVDVPSGVRAVESLRAGDLVLAGLVPAAGGPAGGTALPVARVHVWTGEGPAAAPVRIAAGAFGAGVPRRDLLLSADHAVFADGVLVPARHLVNGRSILRESGGAPVAYVHLELERHGLIFAEGLAVETLLPGVSAPEAGRWSQIWEAAGCAPLVVAGPVLDALRARLLARAVRAA